MSERCMVCGLVPRDGALLDPETGRCRMADACGYLDCVERVGGMAEEEEPGDRQEVG